MNPSISLFLDFETLDTTPTAIVTEIGCIAVIIQDEKISITSQLDLRPAILPQIAAGRTLDPATVQWQREKGIFPETDGTAPLDACATELAAMISHFNPRRIWAWGKDFERPLYENLCRSYGIAIPARQFRSFSCARDHWQTAFGMDAKAPKRTHHALEDCEAEANDLITALKELGCLSAF